MVRQPVPGDVLSAADPHIVVLQHIIKKPFETEGATGMADQTHVQPNRHHFGLRGAFAVQHVETVPGVLKKIVGNTK
jgi:hypothetical protein